MHIIFIINSLESRGGSERVASLLASHLSVHYKITILSRYSINFLGSVNETIPPPPNSLTNGDSLEHCVLNLYFLSQCLAKN